MLDFDAPKRAARMLMTFKREYQQLLTERIRKQKYVEMMDQLYAQQYGSSQDAANNG